MEDSEKQLIYEALAWLVMSQRRHVVLLPEQDRAGELIVDGLMRSLESIQRARNLRELMARQERERIQEQG